MKKRFIRVLLLCLLLFVAACSFGTALAEGLNVYFLDVGQGNSAFIECDGYTMLIDGGPKDASRTIFSFLKDHNVTRIDYMVASHLDADHIGGFPAVREQSVGIFLAPDSTPPFDFLKEYLEHQNQHIIVPNMGDTFSLGGASVTVLGPRRNAVYSDNTSLVLRVVYGKTSFLFMGDSEREDEDALIAYGCNLKSTVLCVGHHGSFSSSTEIFLKKVAPQYAVISVGADNSYGHPHDVVLNRLQKMGITTYRTDIDGQVIMKSDGTGITVTTGVDSSRALPEQISTVQTEENLSIENVTYVGNKKTHKFHLPDCDSVAKMHNENKKYYYRDREEPINEGYEPCGGCKP